MADPASWITAGGTVLGGGAGLMGALKPQPGVITTPRDNYQPTPAGQPVSQAMRGAGQAPMLNLAANTSAQQLPAFQAPDASRSLLEMLNAFGAGSRGGNF